MSLLQHAADHRRWKGAASKKMKLGSIRDLEVSTNPSKKSKYTKSFKRTRSKLVMLYNETGINDELI